ncbi:MAG: hypothetical protein Q8O40_17775, partial [Chloroflexota bacterium]|nr:hypothetical protein [Chloroflexota bacterium]
MERHGGPSTDAVTASSGGEDMSRWLFKTAFHGIVVIALLSLIVATWFTWSRAARAAAAPSVGP